MATHSHIHCKPDTKHITDQWQHADEESWVSNMRENGIPQCGWKLTNTMGATGEECCLRSYRSWGILIQTKLSPESWGAQLKKKAMTLKKSSVWKKELSESVHFLKKHSAMAQSFCRGRIAKTFPSGKPWTCLSTLNVH